MIKKIGFISFALLLVTATLFGQKRDFTIVPSEVKNQFREQFPDIYNEVWTKHKDNTYLAFYPANDNEGTFTQSIFDTNGEWLETQTEVKRSELPKNIYNAARQQFKGTVLNMAMRSVDHNDIVTYLLYLETYNKDIYAVYDEAGKLIKSESGVKGEDDDEEEDSATEK